LSTRREIPFCPRSHRPSGGGRGGIRPPLDVSHRRGDDCGRPSLSGSGGISGSAGALVIVLRFLRTIFGWAWIVADTMVTALIIGIHGEGEASERALRGWARRFLLVAGGRVMVQRDVELDPDRSYVFVSNHTS